MALYITVFPDIPSTIQTVQLDGRSYRVRLDWLERVGAWFLGLGTATGTPILQGVRVSQGLDLLDRADAALRPSGMLVLCDSDTRGAPLAQADLGTRARLIYVTAAEKAQIAASLPRTSLAPASVVPVP